MDTLKPMLKAIVGAIIAGLTAIAAGLTDSSLTAAECVTAAIAFFTALSVVWGVPNVPPDEGGEG